MSKKILQFPRPTAVILNFKDCAERLRKGVPFDERPVEEDYCVEAVMIDGEQRLKGPAVCMGCGHEWVNITEIGPNSYACPSCSVERGVWKTFVYTELGATRRMCSECECELFSIYATKGGKTDVRCSGCGCVTCLDDDIAAHEQLRLDGEVPDDE